MNHSSQTTRIVKDLNNLNLKNLIQNKTQLINETLLNNALKQPNQEKCHQTNQNPVLRLISTGETCSNKKKLKKYTSSLRMESFLKKMKIVVVQIRVLQKHMKMRLRFELWSQGLKHLKRRKLSEWKVEIRRKRNKLKDHLKDLYVKTLNSQLNNLNFLNLSKTSKQSFSRNQERDRNATHPLISKYRQLHDLLHSYRSIHNRTQN